MTRFLFAACAAALTLSACNQATPAVPSGDAGKSEGRGQRSQDLNNDGKVTLDEAKAGQKRMLERADTNKDGKVGFEEIEALSERAAERMDRMDTNGDREVTAAEMAAAAETRFQRRDTNGDGVLTGEEMRMGRRGDRGREGRGPDKDGAPVG